MNAGKGFHFEPVIERIVEMKVKLMNELEQQWEDKDFQKPEMIKRILGDADERTRTKNSMIRDGIGSRFYHAMMKMYNGTFVFAEAVSILMLLENYEIITERTFEQAEELFKQACELSKSTIREENEIDFILMDVFEVLIQDEILSRRLNSDITCMRELLEWLNENVISMYNNIRTCPYFN